mmetsp:Transcript_4479/g.16060  ORF Transcript_4479/g.16060 Transcript_4479/m.16060 type:complete len:328 (+) Transcript_4479:111-1094(+)
MLSASLMPAGPLSCRAPAAAERRMRCTARALLPSRCSIARRAPLSPSHVHTRLRVESGRLRSGVRMGVLDGLLPGGAQPELEDDTRAAAEFFVPTFFLRGKPSSVDEGQLRDLVAAQARDLARRYRGREGALFSVRRNNDGEGAIVACAGVQVDTLNIASSTAEREIARVPVVANVAVGRRARKRGYAKRMMALCEEQAREWGYERCYLVVEANNRPAQTLYRKLGYKKVRADRGTALQVAKGELVERSVTNVTMVKDVSGTPQAILQNIDWLGLLPRAALLAAVIFERQPLASAGLAALDALPAGTQELLAPLLAPLLAALGGVAL